MSRDVRILCRQGRLREALHVMERRGIHLHSSTYPFLLDWCLKAKALAEGKLVHAHMIDSGFNPDIFLGTKLVTMYAKCGSLVDARQVLDKMPERNVVSWTAMIAAYVRHGYNEEALELYYQMQRDGIQPNKFTFSSVVSACGKLVALDRGREVHEDVTRSGFQSDVFVGSALVDMYAKCGGIENAFKVFGEMPERNVVSWNAVIAGYAENGHVDEALKLFQKMPERDAISWNGIIAGYAQNGRFDEALKLFGLMELTGMKPNSSTYATLLQECVNSRNLPEGKLIHAHMIDKGFNPDMFLETKIVIMYAKCGSLVDACRYFDEMPERNVMSWTAIIGAHSRDMHNEKALTLYHQMQMEGIQPNEFTFASVLPACANLATLKVGRTVHGDAIRSGFQSDISVGSALLDMYAQCGSINDARQVFDKMPRRSVISWNALIAGYAQSGHVDEALKLFQQAPERDVVSWNTMIALYAQNGHVDEAMKLFRKMPQRDMVSWNTVIAACAQDGQVDEASNLFQKMPGRDVVSWNTMIAGYVQDGQVDEALNLFQKMPQQNAVSWTALIAGLTQNEYADEALKLFHQMQLIGVKPDSVTFISVLPACTNLKALKNGKEVHGNIIKNGFQFHISASSALVDMYAKCGSIEDACKVFDEMPERNVIAWNALIAGYAQNSQVVEAQNLFQIMPERDMVSWNAMITGYAQNGHVGAALKLYQKMPEQNTVSCTAMISGYAQSACTDEALKLFQKMPERDVISWNAMIAGYVQNGQVYEAVMLFQKMLDQDIISWNVMIAGYANNGHSNEALKLFRQMQLTGVKPDSVSFTSILPACANLTALISGKEAHENIIRTGFQYHISVGSSLVDMYAKCGSIGYASAVFDKMLERDIFSWNAMIVGYAKHGRGKEALHLFEQMQESGMKPDHVTFIGVLSACSHAGLVNDGWQYFSRMSQDYHITPAMEHYCCMVDLLGRAGHLDEAQDFINKMPIEPNAVVWGSLLGACRIHTNIELGEYVAERIFELDPKGAACYVMLSNIYAAASRWDDVEKVRKFMKDMRVKKIPSCSWIEVNNKVCSFLVRNRSASQIHKI